MKFLISRRSGISPAIATIFLVGIAVVGSTITVVFAQNSYNLLQLSGYPEIELLTFTGFDARDKPVIDAHNAPVSRPSLMSTYLQDGKKGIKEVITVFVKNDSVRTVVLDEVKLGGTIYSFSNPPFIIPFGSYAIIKQNLPSDVVLASSPQLEAGQEVTLIFSLDSTIKIGRDLQFKLTTSKGFIVLTTITTGEKKV